LFSWAQTTLREHWDDKREVIYTLSVLEEGRTHDELWNAAQLEMVIYKVIISFDFNPKLHLFISLFVIGFWWENAWLYAYVLVMRLTSFSFALIISVKHSVF
jgi:hypothetical protein